MKRGGMRTGVSLALGMLAGCASLDQVLTAEDLAPQDRAALIAINDVYRINGIQQGKEGSLARVRALRLQLQQEYGAGAVSVFLAGDFLSPSLLSRKYRGAQMVDVLNVLDGAPSIFDPTLFVTFGNHEFDIGSCNQPKDLIQRVRESEFSWLATNIAFDQTGEGPSACGLAPLDQMPNVRLEPELIELDGMKLGVFSITLDFQDGDKANYPRIEDIAKTTRKAVDALRRQGAEFTIALTHQFKRDDMSLIDLGDAGPDLVLGGHEHYCMAFPRDDPRAFKADGDALSANIFILARSPTGDVKLIRTENRRLDERAPKDAATQKLIQNWLSRHAADACGDAGCLDAPIGVIRDALEAEELKNKTKETRFGNWLADVARRAQTANRAEAALINAGSFSLNYDLKAGDTLSRREIEELIRFDPSYLTTVELSGAELWDAVAHMLARRGGGAWAHTSHLRISVSQEQGERPRLTGLVIVRADGTQVLLGPESTQRVRLATNTYLACNGDGYKLQAANLGLRACMADAASGLDARSPKDNMKQAVLAAIRDAGPGGVAFPPADRIGGLDPLGDPDACR